jgi:acyl carrier protein
MGLDIVEIVMQAEEAFDIDIENDEAATADTVGKLHELIFKKLKEKNRAEAHDSEAVWRKLRRIVSDQLQVSEEEVVPEAHFGRHLGAD